MKLIDIYSNLNNWANFQYQESYDNSGIITGNPNMSITGITIALDSTEAVVEEAISRGHNLVVSHHPIWFEKKRNLTGRDYVERTIIKAIKHDIALIAIHTNLDNVLHGVNFKIAEKIGLQHIRILSPVENLYKIKVYLPYEAEEIVTKALFEAGCGNIGAYSDCYFATEGNGHFTPLEDSNPYLGKANHPETVSEKAIEVICPQPMLGNAIQKMTQAHPYQSPAYDIISLKNQNTQIGSGLIGQLPEAINFNDFLDMLSKAFGLEVLKYTPIVQKVHQVALCGGAGSFLRFHALKQGADVFVTSDLKYHEFFDTAGEMSLIDIGHYESEQFTIDIIYERLKKNFVSLPILKTSINTNPVKYKSYHG
ncbi:MAG: Nif3-like dinuclear metal center hexameric protein [Chitinophagales bacterium]|jgi:dinuclear metal center YbgI/SA1388 family protein|nr:Nif3-like dinuclear metal center hexameric protein [Chitinophagales bacterium]